MTNIDLNDFIRDVIDWPKPGIVFKDITPLLKSHAAFSAAIEQMAAPFRNCNIDAVAGTESRGFIFGTAIAQSLGTGFIPIRKPNKLPCKTRSITYDLEYGTDSLEIHTDAVEKSQNVLVVDDLLATGGTLKATCDLITQLNATIVGISVLVELTFLNGAKQLEPHSVHSILKY